MAHRHRPQPPTPLTQLAKNGVEKLRQQAWGDRMRPSDPDWLSDSHNSGIRIKRVLFQKTVIKEMGDALGFCQGIAAQRPQITTDIEAFSDDARSKISVAAYAENLIGAARGVGAYSQ